MELGSNPCQDLRGLSLIERYWLWRKGKYTLKEMERRQRLPHGTLSRLFRERIDQVYLRRYGTRWLAKLLAELFPEEWTRIKTLAEKRNIRLGEALALLGCTARSYYGSEFKDAVKFLKNRLMPLAAFEQQDSGPG